MHDIDATSDGLTYGRAGRALLAASKSLAIAGGLVFVAMVVMSIVSIVGRKLSAWPVPGDVDCCRCARRSPSSAFFAYCHLIGGDVKVDFFTHNLAPPIVNRLDAFGSLLVGAVRRAHRVADRGGRDGAARKSARRRRCSAGRCGSRRC